MTRTSGTIHGDRWGYPLGDRLLTPQKSCNRSPAAAASDDTVAKAANDVGSDGAIRAARREPSNSITSMDRDHSELLTVPECDHRTAAFDRFTQDGRVVSAHTPRIPKQANQDGQNGSLSSLPPSD